MTEAPIPRFTACPKCGGAAMNLDHGKPVTCAFCGEPKTAPPAPPIPRP